MSWQETQPAADISARQNNVTAKGRCPVKMSEKGIRYFVFRHDIDGVTAMTDCGIARDVLKSF